MISLLRALYCVICSSTGQHILEIFLTHQSVLLPYRHFVLTLQSQRQIQTQDPVTEKFCPLILIKIGEL